ncbi:GH25 family lysozyme [Lagierella sp.]|uniref:GH25 family lysozyme n=1 Tax=Lagierella sp. TaxID=2849657 RepID=UPI0026089C47|nr:GH25 family lysozyme [Lagierella sp.]
MKIGVDLSMWNSSSNFHIAKQKGLEFAILRAGSGVTTVDPSFEKNYRGCKDANVNVGAYWYLYAVNLDGARREAKLFLERLKGKSFEYPVYLDLEDRCQNNLSRKILTEIALEFMITVESSGYYVGLYSMGSWFRDKFLQNHSYRGRTLADFDTWVAHWTYSIQRKSSFVKSSTGLWQYTDCGAFPGIGRAGKNLDLNLSFKDYPSIIGRSGLNSTKKIQVVKNKDIILVSKVESVDVSNSLAYLRKSLSQTGYVVETVSGYFDYEKYKDFKILGLGGIRQNHSYYVDEFYGGKDEDVLEQLKKKY